MKISARLIAASLLACTVLSGCSLLEDLPEWLGGGTDKAPIPGKRIAVLSEAAQITPDDSVKDMAVTIPELKANVNWRMAGGGPEGMTGNLSLSGLTHHDRTAIGDGNGWEEPLYPSPIVAEGVVYAMDAKGYITAQNATDIGKQKWVSKALVEEDEPDILGGGLAFDQGHIYATSGRGMLTAIDAATGKDLWKRSLGVPLRAAPKVSAGRLYALSVDNQIFAFDAARGSSLWSHRGMNENSGFLASISPAVTEMIAIAPYSSGEIHALDTSSGQDVWTDSLLVTRRTLASGGFTGVGGNPIIHDDVVYAAGSSGLFSAISLLNGRRIWEQEISSLNTPWIAGDFVYLLSSDDQLVCLLRADGRIRWTRQLPRFENEAKRKNPLVWRGPVMASGQLLIAGQHGQMLALAPADGATLATVEIPEHITDTPIVAGGRLYFLTQDAKLHVLY